MKETRDPKNIALIALIVSYFIIVGADIFAQVNLSWTALAEPPRSLTMYQGEYVYDSSAFWRLVTTLTLVLFVVSLALNWNTPRRRLLLIAFAGFFVINALSFAFVFPEYLDIVGSEYSDTVDPELQSRGAAWIRLALARWAAVLLIGILPLLALARPTSSVE